MAVARVPTAESRDLDLFLRHEDFPNFLRYIEVLFLSQTKPVVQTLFSGDLSRLLLREADLRTARPLLRYRLHSNPGLPHSDPQLKKLNQNLTPNLLLNIKDEIRLNANPRKKDLVSGVSPSISFVRIEEFNRFLGEFPSDLSTVSPATSAHSEAPELETWVSLIHEVPEAAVTTPAPTIPSKGLRRSSNNPLPRPSDQSLPSNPSTLKKGMLAPLIASPDPPAKPKLSKVDSSDSYISVASLESPQLKPRSFSPDSTPKKPGLLNPEAVELRIFDSQPRKTPSLEPSEAVGSPKLPILPDQSPLCLPFEISRPF